MFKNGINFKSSTATALSCSLALTGYFYRNRKANPSHADAVFPYFKVGVTLNPKFEKRYKGGEDAYVIGADNRLLVACDGVGGWGELDVDPGLFSKHLCKTIGELHDAEPGR